jgi:hypothetical protein
MTPINIDALNSAPSSLDKTEKEKKKIKKKINKKENERNIEKNQNISKIINNT